MSADTLLSKALHEEGGKAIPFITIDDHSGRFEVAQQAMVFLESLPRNKKVAVVAIAGPYRTGKSFLANRLLSQSKGFEVGSTTQACTKGIWIWNKPVSVAADQVMVLIDTEGLASTERSTNVDIKIFALTILLASLFIYNQMGPITENSLEDLALVANLSSHISIHQHQGKGAAVEDLKPFFPSFFWVMRDFYHDLEGRTPKQYLEDCLQEAPGFTADVLRKNKIRLAILKHFKERECFTMIRPVSEESKLAHVESLSWDDSSNGLKPEFKRQVTNFVNQVGKKLKPKVIQSKHLNASMLLTLALEYTEAINSKETPTVLTALDRVVQAETIKVIDCNLEAFKLAADQVLSEDVMPMNERDLSKIVRKLVKKHQLELQRQLAQILNFQEILEETQKFKQQVNEVIERKYNLNYSASYHFSKGLLTNLIVSLNTQETSSNSNALQIHDYLRRWAQILKEYKEKGKQSALQWEVLSESIVQLQSSEGFIKRELINNMLDGPSKNGQMAMDYDEDETYSSQRELEESKQTDLYLMDLFESFVATSIDGCNSSLTLLRGVLHESQLSERRLGQSKKQSEQVVDLQKQQNEELAILKNDLDVRIESLKRDVTSRRQEMDQLTQVKEAELKSLKNAQERQMAEGGEEYNEMEVQKKGLDSQHQELTARVGELESEKRKEVSLIQNEIKKLEEDIEALKNKMKSKENNPFFIQVNQFFVEIQKYIEEYRKLCAQSEGSREQKKELFALQRKLADVEYQASQKELTVKKQFNEQLRKHKERLTRAFEARQAEADGEKQRIMGLQEKRSAFEQQLQQSIGLIQDSKERQMTLTENRDNHKRLAVAVKDVRIKSTTKEIQENKELQIRMEDKIYMLSIENKQRQDDKELMLMILPHILKAVKGHSNNLKNIISQIENEGLKNKVMKLLITYKVPGLK